MVSFGAEEAPGEDVADQGRELDAYLYHGTAVEFELPGIVLALYLIHRLSDRPVELQLKKIDVAKHTHQYIDAAVGGVPLGVGVDPYKREEDVKIVLIIDFGQFTG